MPGRILLDIDSTDDPTHGEQEGRAYHGYYGQHMLHPVLVFDGDTGQLITAVLRPGTVHAGHGALAILHRIVTRLREWWPQVEITLRADAIAEAQAVALGPSSMITVPPASRSW